MALKSDRHAQRRTARVAALPPGTAPELVELAKHLRGMVVVPGMDDYPSACEGNPVYPGSPNAVIFCAAPGDVIASLGAARALGWPLTCRSGRHSTAGFSINDGIVIDVSLMNHVVVDRSRMLAHCGAGANYGQLNAVLDTYMVHVPGGGCADVGVAGFSMGGGYGFTSRELGMGCDNIAAATLVLADGTIATASADHNPELHWAVCGGTGNQFGVLIDITYKLTDLYDVWAFCLEWGTDDAAAALDAMQTSFMRGADAPDHLGYQPIFSTLDGKPTLAMLGMFNGSREDGLAAIAPLQAIGKPTLQDLGVGPYTTLNDALLDILPGPGPVGTFEAKRSRYVATPLGEAGWTKVVEYFVTAPNPFNIIGVEPYGGAIERAPADLNAFVHRDVDFDLFVDSFWQTAWPYNDQAEAWRWADGFMETVAPYTTNAVYQNYPERDLADYRDAYWPGDKVYDKLLAVKRATDPNNLFDFPQSVTPRPGGGAASAPGAAAVEIARELYPARR